MSAITTATTPLPEERASCLPRVVQASLELLGVRVPEVSR